MSERELIVVRTQETQKIIVRQLPAPGPQGPIGPIGPQGPKGDTGATGAGGGELGYIHQVTSGEIAAKQLVLNSTPTDATKVKIDFASGCVQVNGVDFTVSGNILSWSSLGMDTVVSVNDYIQITY